MNYFIKPTYSNAIRLNTILYTTYVTKDGVNFIPPFSAGTTEYIHTDPTEPCFYVDDLMRQAMTDEKILIDDRNFIAALIAGEVDEPTAIALGWLPSPN